MGAPESLAADVARVLDDLCVPFTLVGAAALAVHGVTRGSHDVDFMTTDSRVLAHDWSHRLTSAVNVEVLRGDHDDPLAGTVRFARAGATPVDLVVGRWSWQREIIERSELYDLGSFRTRVPRVEDLVLLKIDAGSYLDQRDAALLLELHGAIVNEAVESRIPSLPEPLRRAWRSFVRGLREET